MRTIKERFYAQVEKTDTCWFWTGILSRGYGRIEINGKKIRTHRLSWEIHNGPIPDGMQINHRCLNKTCVNPEHLYVGTQQDNIDDMVKDGTANTPMGESNPASKLTEENVKTIKWLLGLGSLQKDLAVIYGVTITAISYIKLGKSWRHV